MPQKCSLLFVLPEGGGPGSLHVITLSDCHGEHTLFPHVADTDQNQCFLECCLFVVGMTHFCFLEIPKPIFTEGIVLLFLSVFFSVFFVGEPLNITHGQALGIP